MKSPLDRKKTEKIVKKLVQTYEGDSGINFIDVSNLPVRDNIADVIRLLMELLFPGYTGKRAVTMANLEFIVGDILCQAYSELADEIERAYRYQCRMTNCEGVDCKTLAEEVTELFLSELPKVRDLLKLDVQAAYDGDPAAKSFEEVVVSYPYIQAIAIHRLAHELYLRDVPLIPRIMGEYAHSKTGIDIHPGASIGKRFFIDHGTGVVIGETSIIGDNVKMYQGVTLGALSFAKDERGEIIHGGKRHPKIEDNVVIYAEATILGNVTIGKDSIVSGNMWVKESIPPGVTVVTSRPELIYKKHKPDKKK